MIKWLLKLVRRGELEAAEQAKHDAEDDRERVEGLVAELRKQREMNSFAEALQRALRSK